MDRLFAARHRQRSAVGRWAAAVSVPFAAVGPRELRRHRSRIIESFRVIVPELPGFGRSQAVTGGLAAVADRMAEAVEDAAGGEDAIVLGNGYGGFVALQMAIRHPEIASKLVLADCGAAFSEPGREAFRNMAAASKAKGLAAITDVAMRRLFAPEFQAAASGPDAGSPRSFPAHRPGRVSRRLRCAGGARSARRTCTR